MTDAASSKLAACPFCNEAEELALHSRREDEGQYLWVVCYTCGGEGPRRTTPEKAIAAWNRRVTPQPEAQQPGDGPSNARVNDARSRLIRRVEHILDPSASAAERARRRLHLTNYDLCCIIAALQSLPIEQPAGEPVEIIGFDPFEGTGEAPLRLRQECIGCQKKITVEFESTAEMLTREGRVWCSECKGEPT